MKVNYKTMNQRLSVEIDAESAKDVFKKLAEFQEIFDESCCGLCKNEDLQFIVRTVDGNDYYELKCNKCYGKLAFGQHKSGGSLFPKRKKDDGSFDGENKGWHKWNGNGS
ncbi:MAG: hypothetical protein COU64_06435 [Candidatus Pacebacteria bacterium CG10_big_fil_rev_8_21_14_0_10_40_26]|nr:MAG: hypothetical protein COU64_06435 [Candidatus Pacebacteria bacterium CG10_big_fil_rev_8_21_14_0_10_40_26]